MVQTDWVVSISLDEPCSPCTVSRYPLGNGTSPRMAWSAILGKTSTSHAAEVEKSVTLGSVYSTQCLVFTFSFPTTVQCDINLCELPLTPHYWANIHILEFTATSYSCLIHALVFKCIWEFALNQVMIVCKIISSRFIHPVSGRGSSSSDAKVQHWPASGMDACVQRAEVGRKIGPTSRWLQYARHVSRVCLPTGTANFFQNGWGGNQCC